jgi:hypothetical protein
MELNRYVYAIGNPTRFSDPTGFTGLDSTIIQEEISTDYHLKNATFTYGESVVIVYDVVLTALRLAWKLALVYLITTAMLPRERVNDPDEDKDDKQYTIVELGAGDYSNAITMKSLFPQARIIATNLTSVWEQAKLFYSAHVKTDNLYKMYLGWLMAKWMGIEVGESKPLENLDVPSGIGDFVYTVSPTPSILRQFGRDAARIASQKSRTIVLISAEYRKSLELFIEGFNDKRPGSRFIISSNVFLGSSAFENVSLSGLYIN